MAEISASNPEVSHGAPENIYFRNVNNNAGIFDYLIATAEDQGTKEAALAYHFIRKAEPAPTATEIAGRVETWLAKNFAVNLDFKIANALETLNRFGLVRREASGSCPPARASNCPIAPGLEQFFKRD